MSTYINRHWEEGKAKHLELSEQTASDYDNSYANANFSTGLYMDYELRVINKAISLLNISKQGIALDLGCGTGRDSFHINKKNLFSKIIGYDFSQEMITIAKRNKNKLNINNIDFIQKDIDTENLNNIEDESIDFINSGFGMGSFISNIETLLTDINRTLIPKGIFTMSFYNSKSLLNEFPNLDWTPSLSAKIDPQKKSLHVTFNDYEFDISAHSYSINDIRKIMNKYFYIEEISSFPTLSSILPNSILKNSRIKKIVRLVDYELRYNNVYGGHYINVIGRKK